MANITVDVTQEDINTGKPSSFSSCPIALAVKRIYPKAEIVSVGHKEATAYLPEETRFKIFVKSKAKFIRIALPNRARAFITNFDAYGQKDPYVKPFSFEATTFETEQ